MLIVAVFLFHRRREFLHGAKETTRLNADAFVSPEGDQLAFITSEQPEVNKWTRAVINL